MAGPPPGRVMNSEVLSSRPHFAAAACRRVVARVGALIAFAAVASSAPAFAGCDPATAEHIQAAIPMPAGRPGFPITTSGVPITQTPTLVDLNEDGRNEI